MTLIKSAGRRWSPQLVDWSRGGPGAGKVPGMLGYVNKKPSGGKGALSKAEVENQKVDIWDVHGVYSLFLGDEVIYIGEGILGPRLYSHYRLDEFSGRWDSFSWLSPWYVNAKTNPYTIEKNTVEKFEIEIKSLIELMELISINLADPPGNRQNPTAKKDISWLKQLRAPSAPITLDERLKTLESKLDSLLNKSQ